MKSKVKETIHIELTEDQAFHLLRSLNFSIISMEQAKIRNRESWMHLRSFRNVLEDFVESLRPAA